MPVVEWLTDPYSDRLRREYGLEGIEITDEQVRTARHGYYGSISYVDDCVGDLLATLERTGQSDGTVVVFTTDHGDMMGERGRWYKRSFFEGSSRIPLMVAWPGTFAPGRSSANVSLVDLLPTLLELAGGGVEPVDPLDGSSLVGACGTPTAGRSGTVFGENLSEGANAPILMVLDDDLRYVWSGCDPAQLFDLSDDPEERNDLATDPGRSADLTRLDEIRRRRWDVEDLEHRVLESQRRRAFLRSLYTDRPAPEWRTSPPDQAAQRVLPEGVRYNDWVYGDVLD